MLEHKGEWIDDLSASRDTSDEMAFIVTFNIPERITVQVIDRRSGGIR